MSRIFKRLAVGRPISTYEEAHHRLSKKIALAVFSSDALSSSAYATDEILLRLMLAGTAALAMGVPIAIAVAVVLTVVIVSYRQTVQAYPLGGGAYTVAHENLGAPAGLVAASALLIDYVLTVSVSLAAGVAAVAAAFPAARDSRIFVAVVGVALITVLNLRGLKESGAIFAIPTYGFLVSMFALIAIGFYKSATGQVSAYSAPHLEQTRDLSLFLFLQAFSSGATALTGVEAISNGVPAFRKPETKNAAATLATLGILLGLLFMGITVLSRMYHVDPELIHQGKTVVSQIGEKVFGRGPMFYAVQTATALILFLAANTSFADFPRLASILARDRYLPRALQHRGDRLAFSNGIVILAIAASALLVVYKADVHKIIPLYVIGVFTSFTLSQAGMVVHWRRTAAEARRLGRSEPRGWKRAAVISAAGALTTFLVLVIVSVTKFRLGAWQVMILIPALAWLLHLVHVHYGRIAAELRMSKEPLDIDPGKVVLLVSGLGGATKALAFARALAPEDLRVVTLGKGGAQVDALETRWRDIGILTPVHRLGGKVHALLKYVDEMGHDSQSPVTVIIPDPQYKSALVQVIKGRRFLAVKRAFLYEAGTVVISVPYSPSEPEPQRLQAPGRLSLIVFVSSVHRATARALKYAHSLRPSELKAMSIQTHPGEAAELTEQWSQWGLDVPLEIVDSPFRSLIEPVIREVRELGPNPNDAVGVVVPEFVVGKWWQAILHNQTAFLIKSALLFEPNVVVINVPYHLGTRETRKKAAGPGS